MRIRVLRRSLVGLGPFVFPLLVTTSDLVLMNVVVRRGVVRTVVGLA